MGIEIHSTSAAPVNPRAINADFSSLREEIMQSKMEERFHHRKIIELKPPEIQISYEQWLGEMQNIMPDITPGAVALADTVAQLHMQYIVNPVAIALRDSPSSGKTVCLNLFSGLRELCLINDEFTANALMSGSVNNKDGSKDFVKKMKNKATIIPDLATLFSGSDDSIRGFMGKITRILDGQGYSKADGANGAKSHGMGSQEADKDHMLVMLMATTELQPRIWWMMAGLGPRWFFMDLGSRRPTSADIREFLLHSDDFSRKEAYARYITEQFMRTFWQGQPAMRKFEYEDDSVAQIIADLAILMSYMRSDLQMMPDRFNKQKIAHSIPQQEFAWRLSVGLRNFAHAHCHLRGGEVVTLDDMETVFRLALGTGQAPRPSLLKLLIRNNGKADDSLIAEQLRMTRPQAKRELAVWDTLQFGRLEKLKIENDNPFGIYTGNADPGEQEYYDDEITFTLHIADDLKWLTEAKWQDYFTKKNIC